MPRGWAAGGGDDAPYGAARGDARGAAGVQWGYPGVSRQAGPPLYVVGTMRVITSQVDARDAALLLIYLFNYQL